MTLQLLKKKKKYKQHARRTPTTCVLFSNRPSCWPPLPGCQPLLLMPLSREEQKALDFEGFQSAQEGAGGLGSGSCVSWGQGPGQILAKFLCAIPWPAESFGCVCWGKEFEGTWAASDPDQGTGTAATLHLCHKYRVSSAFWAPHSPVVMASLVWPLCHGLQWT